MSLNPTKIAWTCFTWNPVTGCSKISEGCKNCYAEKVSNRFAKISYGGVDENGEAIVTKDNFHFKVKMHPDRLYAPLKRKKPAKIFVCSMGDLFHDDVPDDFIDDVFCSMGRAGQHTFQVLTKRPNRMLNYIKELQMSSGFEKPLPNVWLGVTAENQATADERIPLLLQTPAAVRFVSAEPLLDNLILDEYFKRPPILPDIDPGSDLGIDWIIVGGETGSGARECREEWIKSIYDQCQSANVPFFYKQMGKNNTSLKSIDQKVFAHKKWGKRREWPR